MLVFIFLRAFHANIMLMHLPVLLLHFLQHPISNIHHFLVSFVHAIITNQRAQFKKIKENIQILENVMEFSTSIFDILSRLSFDLPRYVGFSPLCIISSTLYKDVLGIDMDDETAMLIITLLAIWITSATMLFHLIRTRTYKSIFFYEFMLYITVVSFSIIGVTYSLLGRKNLQEEVLAKILTTLLIIYLAESIKGKDTKTCGEMCNICFEATSLSDCMILKCRHQYHQKCLWDWIYIKQACPTCQAKLN